MSIVFYRNSSKDENDTVENIINQLKALIVNFLEAYKTEIESKYK